MSSLEQMINKDKRLIKYNGIKLILQRSCDRESNDLFFISPDAGTKFNIIREIVETYKGLVPEDILYNLNLLSLNFDAKFLLESLADCHKPIDLHHLFAYYAKTGSIPFKILQRVIEKYSHTQSNTVEHFRVNAFLLNYYFSNNNFELAEKHIKYCLEYLENNVITSAYDSMVLYYICGKYLEKTGDIFTGGAEGYFLKALRISEELRDDISRTSLLNSLAYFSHNMKASSRAMEYANLALEATNRLDIDSMKFTTLRNLGILSITMGDLAKGTEYINSAIEYSYKVLNLPAIETVRLLNTLGFYYWMMGRFENSLNCHLKAFDSLSRIENSSELLDEAVKTCDNLSNSFRMMGDLNRSVYFADISVKIIANTTFINRSNEVHNLCKQYTDAGIAYALYLNDYGTALKYYKLARESISEQDHYIKREKLNMLESYIKAYNGDRKGARQQFEEAAWNLSSAGRNHLYAQLLLMEFYFFFAIILEDEVELLNKASEISHSYDLGPHYNFLENLLVKGTGIHDVPIDLHQYPVNLILMISEERRNSAIEAKKAKDFQLLEDFSKKINTAITENALYNEAEVLFNKYFLSKGFISIRHSFNEGLATTVHLHKNSKLNAETIKISIEEFIEKNDLLSSYDAKGYRIYNLESSSSMDNIKSMIMYNIYDDITSNSYFFVIFNDSKCNWWFSESDAHAGLVLVKNLFLKLKHIQYVDSFKSKAITDSLTGLYNSDYMWTTLRSQTSTQPTDLTLVFIDLDKFKQINDTLGHAAGDEALRFFCQLLRIGFNPYNQIIRYGGDEFVILLPGVTVKEGERLVSKLKRLCQNNLLEIENHKVNIEFSYGLDSFKDNYRDYSEFFRAVDCLMYLNKRGK